MNPVSNSKAIQTRSSFLHLAGFSWQHRRRNGTTVKPNGAKKKNARSRIRTGVLFCSPRELGTDLLRLRSAFIKYIDTLANARVDPIPIQTVLRQEQFRISVSH